MKKAPDATWNSESGRSAKQQLLFSELAPHLKRMALFDVNTGLRDQELCDLQWSWEQRVPELDTAEIKRSVFVLPATHVKNRQARAVILNDVAQSVLEEVRGSIPCMSSPGRTGTGSGIGWGISAIRGGSRPGDGRRSGISKELGKEAPAGFKNVRVLAMTVLRLRG